MLDDPIIEVPDWYVAAVAGFLGLTTRKLNRGQHYEWRQGRLLLEWWPSTGRTGINRVYTDRRRIRTLRTLRKWLMRKATEYCNGGGLANWTMDTQKDQTK